MLDRAGADHRYSLPSTPNDDPAYNELMRSVSNQIMNPDGAGSSKDAVSSSAAGTEDVEVRTIFTPEMMTQLVAKMKAETDWDGIDETVARFENDLASRKIFSGFLTDPVLGKKRLISMTDRVTNTIQLSDGNVATRPTVINCYSSQDLGTLEAWWEKWMHFMFDDKFSVNRGGELMTQKATDLIVPIKKSKYPSITAEEEKISKPLQVVCAGIFDAILVHMMNRLAPKKWQPMRQDICEKLNRNKFVRTAEILETSYSRTDVIFLQEVAGSFSKRVASRPLSKTFFDIYSPSDADPNRDQNSFILLLKDKFVNIVEVTSDVTAILNENNADAPVSKGDIFVITATSVANNADYVFASFHGDTNGLATIPIVEAVSTYVKNSKPGHKLLFGMDANTYTRPDEDQQGVTAFAKWYSQKGLNSCWGKRPDPNNFTTFHARTHLQSQLNKAVALEDKDKKGDKNPKDFVIFFDEDFTLLQTTKDNTGARKYIENMVFPTLDFPSDHGITSSVMLDKPKVLATNLRGNE